ncbi:MAG: glucuronate isomerase [Clostridia bacterium]|nr:glucuronate isomerase [Clostridia bacterium]
MNNNFFLNTETSEKLYKYACGLPIIDYHNHLSPEDIAENKRYLDVYDLWIKPDPYKHRAMRMCGVAEEYITGCKPGREKFFKWCETVPKLIGNPLYVWSIAELKAVFNIDEMPAAGNAERIYNYCNEYLKKNNVCVNTLLEKFNVEYACPCASLTDDISMYETHSKLAPSLRGDDIVNISAEFLNKLEKETNIHTDDLDSFKRAVRLRLEYFHKCGCRFSDHALDNGFVFYEDDGKNEERFYALKNGFLSDSEKEKLSSYILVFLGGEYARLDFTMQLHIGAQRYTSSVLREVAGPAGGFAGIGNSVNVKSLTTFLDALDCTEYRLPKTILFTLNPADNAIMSVLAGSYSRDGVSGLITQGPAWWWCDNKYAIAEMLENTSVFGVLSNFVGMTTDSRSFLSFVRHDYFRRILCDFLGSKYERNELCCAYEDLERLVYKVCYENAGLAIQGGKADESQR